MALRHDIKTPFVQINATKAFNILDYYANIFPDRIAGACEEVAMMYARTFIKQIKEAGIEDWTGRSKGVLQKQTAKGGPRLRKGSRGKGEFGTFRQVSKKGDIRIKLPAQPTFQIEVPNYLISLDRLKQPHWVKLKRGRAITRWARDARKLNLKQIPGWEPSISIDRHPWIDAAFARGNKNVMRTVNRVKNRAEAEARRS